MADERLRGRERSRRLATTLASGVASRVIQAAIAFAMVPALLRYLGVDRFGVWATLSSLVAMLGLAAQGIGNGLVQRLADAKGRDDPAGLAVSVSSAAVLLGLISAAFLGVYVVFHGFVDWGSVLNVSTSQAGAEAGPAMAWLAAIFAFNLAFSFVPRVQYGMQDGHLANAWQMVASVLAAPLALLALQFGLGVSGVVLAMLGFPGLVILVSGFHYRRRHAFIVPRWQRASTAEAKRILAIGWLSFLFQTIQTVAMQMDNVIVARTLGMTEVVELSVPMRLFVLIQTVNVLIVSTLWPAYGEAFARGDRRWIRTVFGRTLRVAAVAGLAMAVALTLAGQWLIRLWVGDAVTPSHVLLGGVGVLGLVMSCGTMVTSLLSGAGILRLQVRLSVLMLGTVTVLKLASIRAVGVDALPWAMSAAYLVCYLLPALWYAKRHVLEGTE